MKRDRWIAFIPFYLLTVIIFIGIGKGGSRLVTAWVQNRPQKPERYVVIDAGHGGEDGGASSCTGALESNINLEIALRLDDLMHLLGQETVMIRKTDTSVYTSGNTLGAKKVSDLKERVRIVNECENPVLVSIHQNIFPDSRYGGAQVFYANTQGSQPLAAALQNQFTQTINPGSNRKCKRADNIYLMEHIQCPGILIECGFLSNPEEEAKLRSRDYQKKLVCVIAACVLQESQT